jgi:hypothetical protein
MSKGRKYNSITYILEEQLDHLTNHDVQWLPELQRYIHLGYLQNHKVRSCAQVPHSYQE